jgi:hypothetical protein
MTVQVGPARVVGAGWVCQVMHDDQVLLTCIDQRLAMFFATGYNQAWRAAGSLHGDEGSE